MMEKLFGLIKTNVVERVQKAYLVMLFVQLTYAGMAMFSKAAVSKGMSPSVFVAYRQAFATLALLPLSFFLDRKTVDPLSGRLLLKIFFISLIGITMSLNLYMYSIQFVSATLASASVNSIPALTFLIAVIFRIERFSVRDFPGILKIVGTGVTLSGAMVFALAKGPLLSFSIWSHHHHHSKINGTDDVSNRHTKWINGCLLMLAANTTWAFWLVTQAYLVKQYPAKMKLMMLEGVFSCLQSTVWGLFMERNNLSTWKPKLDMNLFYVAYCGVIITGLSYWMQLWAVENKGPLFTATFTPFALVITATFSAFLWNETPHLGSLFGGMLLVGGLYCVLWGKNKEPKKERHGNKLDEGKDENEEEAVDKLHVSKNQDNKV